MNARGTLSSPSSRDPRRQPAKQHQAMRHTASGAYSPRRTDAGTPTQNRNREMQLMPESLTRAHIHSRLQEAESERRALRVVNARRLQRRAERASLRARRAIAMAVMQ
ncbi:hypothetical protein LHJ74_18580 [Streptomyces sp. N2-109]|uniref:Uncharacterized protein n=1 Tax=Streptomyces gossypii TaxID=2883101 RepID=A0ABT2JX30_9ACTN|nr:hypothetical protein [Streptomyces gossypii]MCT2591880.1 hypothetical protein [Streptomyces gossypii]